MARSALNQHTSSFHLAEAFRLFGISTALLSSFFNRQTRACVLLVVFSVFIQTNLVGCILPLLTPASTILEKPFPDESKTLIKVGVNTKGEVENILGTPDATRRNGSIYIYAKPYIYMKFYLFAYLNHGSARDFQTHHLLIIQFDRNGIVKDFDHISGNDCETQNGIYVADTGLRSRVTKYYGTVAAPIYAPVSQMLVLYSPSDIETSAKQFLIPAGKSAIYAYCEPNYFSWFIPENGIAKVSVSLDTIKLGDFGAKGFFYWIVDPGSHSMIVTPIYPETIGRHGDALTIECIEGQISFVELTWDFKGFLGKEQHYRINIVSDSDKGRQEILKRRNVLDCLTPID